LSFLRDDWQSVQWPNAASVSQENRGGGTGRCRWIVAGLGEKSASNNFDR
jgi:hypothetical protein